MADALVGAGAKEQAEGDRLALTAAQVSGGCLSSATVAASSALITIAGTDDPASGLRRLRSDPRISSALDNDIRIARNQALVLLSDALWSGFLMGCDTRTVGLPLTVNPDASDRAALTDYPVLGHTCSEIADDLATKLRWDVDVAIAQPLTSTVSPGSIPAAIMAAAAAHAQRVGGSVGEAYHAGVQAAVLAIGRALTGSAA